MEFKTAFKRGETTYSPLGSETAPVYEYRIDQKTGKRILTKCGETNLYEKIQASHEGTKIENIIKRCQAGDTSVLNVKNGQYIDITEIPNNMLEMQNLILKTKAEFEKLDAETRKKFENSAEKYVSLYGSEEWELKMGIKKENPKDTETKPIEETKTTKKTKPIKETEGEQKE